MAGMQLQSIVGNMGMVAILADELVGEGLQQVMTNKGQVVVVVCRRDPALGVNGYNIMSISSLVSDHLYIPQISASDLCQISASLWAPVFCCFRSSLALTGLVRAASSVRGGLFKI